MFNCKNCGTEMVKVYAFEDEKNYQQFRCPNCGATTKERPIEYDDKGNLIDGKKKKKKNDSENPEVENDTEGAVEE